MYSRGLVFASACLGMLLFGVVFLSLGAASNMLSARFGFSDSQIGTLAALLPAGILGGSLLFGPVVDRFGYRWVLIAAAIIVGIALQGLAFAESERVVQLCFFFIGFGGGVLNGATNALVADISEGERGANLSLLGVFFGIGALMMPVLLASLSRRYALSTIVSGIGAVVLLPVVFCLTIRFPPPKQRRHSVPLSRIFELLRDPIFLFAGLALAIQSGMEAMSNDWMTRYFKTVTLVGREVAEWQTQLGIVAVTGAMVLTRLALAGLLKYTSSAAVLFGSVAIAACGALTLLNASSYAMSLVAALLIGSGLAAAFPVVLGYVGDRYPEQSGTAFSTIFVIALIGNMTINKTFGYIAQLHGIEQYARVMLVLLTCSAVLLLLIIRQISHDSKAPS